MTGVFAAQAAAHEPLTIEGTGEHFRDFIHVHDIARGLTLALQHPTLHQNVVNLGSGEAVSVQEVADLVSSNQVPRTRTESPRPPSFLRRPRPSAHSLRTPGTCFPVQVHVAERAHDLTGTLADTCRAKRLLNFETHRNFREEMPALLSADKESIFDSWWRDVRLARGERTATEDEHEPRQRRRLADRNHPGKNATARRRLRDRAPSTDDAARLLARPREDRNSWARAWLVAHGQALGGARMEHGIDLVLAGPVNKLGVLTAGTFALFSRVFIYRAGGAYSCSSIAQAARTAPHVKIVCVEQPPPRGELGGSSGDTAVGTLRYVVDYYDELGDVAVIASTQLSADTGSIKAQIEMAIVDDETMFSCGPGERCPAAASAWARSRGFAKDNSTTSGSPPPLCCGAGVIKTSRARLRSRPASFYEALLDDFTAADAAGTAPPSSLLASYGHSYAGAIFGGFRYDDAHSKRARRDLVLAGLAQLDRMPDDAGGFFDLFDRVFVYRMGGDASCDETARFMRTRTSRAVVECIDRPNTGLDVAGFTQHVISHYSELPDEIVFSPTSLLSHDRVPKIRHILEGEHPLICSRMPGSGLGTCEQTWALKPHRYKNIWGEVGCARRVLSPRQSPRAAAGIRDARC